MRTIAPTFTLYSPGVTEIARTMGVTVTVALPETPAAVAVIDVVPADTAVTVALAPLPETVAMAVFDDDHVMALVAVLGVNVAERLADAPIPCSGTVPGDTETIVTAGGGGVVPPPEPSPPPPHAVMRTSVTNTGT